MDQILRFSHLTVPNLGFAYLISRMRNRSYDFYRKIAECVTFARAFYRKGLYKKSGASADQGGPRIPLDANFLARPRRILNYKMRLSLANMRGCEVDSAE